MAERSGHTRCITGSCFQSRAAASATAAPPPCSFHGCFARSACGARPTWRSSALRALFIVAVLSSVVPHVPASSAASGTTDETEESMDAGVADGMCRTAACAAARGVDGEPQGGETGQGRFETMDGPARGEEEWADVADAEADAWTVFSKADEGRTVEITEGKVTATPGDGWINGAGSLCDPPPKVTGPTAFCHGCVMGSKGAA